MGALGKYLSAIGRTVLTLGDGFAVTFSYMFRKPPTLQYPDRTERPVVTMLPERSRGILENDIELCTGCAMCSKQCPIDCIHVQVDKDPDTKQRLLSRFDIDAAKCMYCGLCVEACPASSLRHSHEFEGSMGDVRRLMLKFVDRPRPVAKPPKKGEPVKTKPLGSIVRKLLADQWISADEFKADLGWAPPPPAPKPAPKAVAEKPDPGAGAGTGKDTGKDGSTPESGGES